MRAVLAVLGLTLALGCSSAPETRYYTLAPAEPAAPAGSGRPVPKTVALVDRFVVDEPYQDGRIAYRTRGHELGYDPYSRWAGAPAALVEDAVRDALRDERVFADVRQGEPIGAGRSAYAFVVTGRVHRLEEVDQEDAWHAALELELFLLDGKTREVLASRATRVREAAERRNPEAVVARLARLLRQATAAFAQEVRPTVARRAEAGP